MGNVCCGEKEESKKASAFQTGEHDIDEKEAFLPASGGTADLTIPTSNASYALHSTGGSQALSGDPSSKSSQQQLAADPLEAARLQAARKEEARLQRILQEAGRAMVAVRSTRGSTAYYDQGFAAALGQHLEQTTRFPEHLPARLPSSAGVVPTAVYTRLSKPPWQDVQLGDKDGLAGCAGENPYTYLDQKAEEFLDQVRPKKENLFAGVPPIVENLL